MSGAENGGSQQPERDRAGLPTNTGPESGQANGPEIVADLTEVIAEGLRILAEQRADKLEE